AERWRQRLLSPRTDGVLPLLVGIQRLLAARAELIVVFVQTGDDVAGPRRHARAKLVVILFADATLIGACRLRKAGRAKSDCTDENGSLQFRHQASDDGAIFRVG